MHVYGWALVAVALALFVGATLQGVIGFGMVAIAFPVLVLANDSLLPQTVLLVSLPVIAVMLVRNWSGANWSEVGWLAAGRIPGALFAVLLLRVLSSQALALAGGLMVLAAVAVSLWAPPVPHSPRNLVSAGLLSGTFGTAIGIGGPPLGLLYQHETGARLRSTISVLMMLGSPISVLILLAAGEMTATDFRTAAALIPGALAGVAIAPRAHADFDDRLQRLVLVVCAVSAIAAMARIIVS